MAKVKTILDLIGKTPMVKLNRVTEEGSAEVWAKLEGFNPGGSIKDRPALAMIEDAEKKGMLRKGMKIVEPTSGNTGIGLAMVAAVRGYGIILTMPESMTVERRRLLEAYGAELVLTPADKGMKGAIAKADEIVASGREYFKPDQFGNPANPQVHRRTTAKEIIATFGATKIDAFVAGVGTGGTITGVGEGLKKKFKNIKVIAVEPADSPVLSGGQPGRHVIQGIGAGFVPAILNTKVYDEIIKVTNDDAADTTARLAREEGLLVGVSSGAACWAALQVAKRYGKGKRVVTIFPDVGERYLTTGVFERKSGS
jgi:cysteine synthase A